jgi:Spy/CpxP family protein refolding chaperone
MFCGRLLPAVFLALISVSTDAQSAQPGQASPSRPAPQSGGGSGGNRPGGSQTAPLPDGVRPAPRNWWTQKSDFNTKLHLTADQSNRIQQIFDTGWAQLLKQYDELDRHLNKLSRYIREDETLDLISQQIDRVEATRSAANKSRTLMLLEMRRVLSAQQRATLEVLSEQWMKEEAQRQQQRQNTGPRQDQNRKPDQNSSPDRRGGRPGL